ncbi:MAG TPA: hypothetical protein VKB35_02080 [Ktedonobacteraceae bacterium]|nr:hypothetical protein [Ktedonobacteraceae bacterium]
MNTTAHSSPLKICSLVSQCTKKRVSTTPGLFFPGFRPSPLAQVAIGGMGRRDARRLAARPAAKGQGAG